MAINFRRKLEGVAAQLNPFDQGKTYSSVVNQPQRPAPQGGGSVSVGAPVSQAPAYTPGRISVSGAPPSQQPQPQSNFQIARNAFQSNPVGRVAGGLASSFALPYNVVGKGLGTAIAQVSPDVRRAKASQDMLAEQNKQSVAALNQQLRNPGLSVEQRAKVQKAVGAITQNTQDVMGQQAQTAQDVAAITDPRKQAASIGSIGFDIATLGVGTGGAKAVSAALKSGGIKQAAKTLGTQSAKTAGLAAPSGALFPVIEKGKDATIKDILTGAGTAAAFGAALPGISSGVAAGAKPIVKAIKGAPKLNQVGAVGKNILDDGGKVKGAPIEKTPKTLDDVFNDPNNIGLFEPAQKQANAFQDTLPSKSRPDSIKVVVDGGGTPLYHDTDAKGIMGILDSGTINPSQAPFSQVAGQGKRVSTTRNFDNYSRYHDSPYRLVIDESKTGQKSIPDNREEFESIFNKPVSTKAVQSVAVDITNPALIKDIQNGTFAKVVEKAKQKGIVIEPFEGKILPNDAANAEIQKLTKELYAKSGAPIEKTPNYMKDKVTPEGYFTEGRYKDSAYPKSFVAKTDIPDTNIKAGDKVALVKDRNGNFTAILDKPYEDGGFYVRREHNIDPNQFSTSGAPIENTANLSQGGYVQVPGKTPTTKVTQEQLFDTDPLSTFRAKVRTVGGEKNVPVTKVATQGDVLTKTNVKTGAEKRFTIDDAGELIPDRKGAYRIFSDKENKITGFRIGDKFYDGKDFGNLADVNNYGSTIATMRRNLERAYKDNPVAQDKVQRFIVDHQQEQATKMVERQVALRDGAQALADDLGINFRTGTRKAKDVSADIQNFGEGVITKEDLVSKYGSDKASKIIRADSWFRNQYDSLLNEMNTTLTKFGYSPVPKRENYYTHFQEPSLWKNFGLKMQEINDAFGGPMQEATPTATRGSIPNALAGQSEYLLPNKRFNPFAKKREGGAYTPDAFKAFERYLSPTLNNIYMTPSIARTRVMTKAIAQANDLAGNDVNKLALQMTEWANELAGKTNRWDRTLISSDWAGKALKASEYVQRKVGQQSIVGNLATAVMQPVVLAQTAAKAGYKNTLLGLLQEFPGAPGHAKDAPIRLSGFLKRRYLNTTPVTSGKMDKASSIAGTPLKVIEETAGRVTWNSYYNQALEKGLKGKEAIRHADIWAEKTMAGRSIGEKPELYRAKSMGIATQFQLEVNNMWQQLGKEFSKTEVAKFVVASYAVNMLIQEIIGRQPSFNPLDAAIDSVAIMANDEKTAKQKGVEVAQRVGGEIVGSTPILPSAIGAVVPDDITKKVFGNQTPVGRFGVGSTAGSLVENTVGKVLQGKPLEAGAYLATPFGYGQAQKTVKGINAVSQGKLTNKDGETTVEIPQTPINYVKGALFGPSAIKEVNQYYNNIGVKSEDQKPVQNQTTSVAAKQGGGSATTEKSRGDLMKEAKTITKQGFEGKYAKLSEEQITNLAQNGDEDALSLMNSLKAQEKVYAKPNLPTAGLNKSAEDILNKEKKFTETGRKAWGSKQVSDKTLQSAVNQWKPANAPDVPVNNNIAIEWAKYERDDKLGKLTELEKRDKRVSILKKAYTSDLNEDEARYGGMSDAKLADAVDEGLISPDSLKKALDADAKLIAYGLIDKSSFGKKIWAAFGLGVPGSKSSGGGYASGRNGGSRGGGGGKAVAAKAINPYKYNVSLTAGGSVAKPKVQARAVGAVKSQKVAKAKPKVSIKKSTA